MTQPPTKLTDIVNLFPPMALTEEQKAFYQKTAAVRDEKNEGKYEFYEQLYERIIEANKKTHFLVVGHRGCGKSTELRMLTLKLRENNTPSITISAGSDFDLNNFSYIDIFMRIVERLVEYAKEEELHVPEKLISAFHIALSTTMIQEYRENNEGADVEAKMSLSAPIPFLLRLVSQFKASIKTASGQRDERRQKIDPKMEAIINALNALIDKINGSDKNKIVIVIDDLEKCRTENAKELFSSDIAFLCAINTHLIVTCPIDIYRSPVANTLQGYFVRPAKMRTIKTHLPDSLNKPYKAGINVIKSLIRKRVADSFFDEGVLDRIIKMAGGSLRDTCNLVSESAFEAHMRKKKTVDIGTVEIVIDRFSEDIFFRAESRFYSMIKRIYDGERKPRNDADLDQLLYAGVVFEYNGKGWIDLHPLLRHYIDMRPGVLDDPLGPK